MLWCLEKSESRSHKKSTGQTDQPPRSQSKDAKTTSSTTTSKETSKDKDKDKKSRRVSREVASKDIPSE
jgi:hypothetical protein